MKHFALTLALISCLCASAHTLDTDTIRLADVEVNATPKASVELLPLTLSIISDKQLEQSGETSILPVLSDQVPGLFVTERGMAGYGVSGGAAGQVSIRGVGGGNKVLFMIDGQPQWASIFGHALPDTYTSGDVAKVEVVRGPSSMLYGSNAMGGSVNIITRHATQPGTHGSAQLMWGSYGTQKYGVSIGHNHQRFNAFANVTYEHSDGSRPNSRYWLASQFASLQYRVSDHWKLGANVTLTETTPHNPGSVQDPLIDMWSRIVRGTAAIFVNNTYDVSSGQLQVYANWGHHTVNDGYSASGTATNNGVPRDYLFHSDDYNMGVNAYQNVRPWLGNVTSVGIDWQHWGGRTWNTPIGGGASTTGVDEHVDEVAAYLMTQQGIIGQLLSVNAGLRVQHSSQFGNMLVPQAGAILRPISGNTVKLSWGKGFRSPNLRELYLYPPHNPDLKPEYLWNYEMEIRQLWLGGHLNTGLSLYYIDGKDMIQTVAEQNPVTGGPMTNKNIGDFTNKGFEVDATYHITPRWSVAANYSYLHSSDNVLYAPKHKLFGQVMYHTAHWQLTLESVSVWGLRTAQQQTQDYSLINARVAYVIGHSACPVTLFCKGDNLTAARYETIYGFPMPRATVMAGVQLKF